MPRSLNARQAGLAVRRRLRRARLSAALTMTGTALIMGGVIVSASLAYVMQTWGLLRDGAWAWGLAAGSTVVFAKVLADLFDHSNDAGLWRGVLQEAFGEGMRADTDVARQARLAIEFRTRLAAAEAEADAPSRRMVAADTRQLDAWLDGIVDLARRVASQRGEANFQSGLATRARQRRNEIASRMGEATDEAHAQRLQQAVRGVDAQIKAAENYARAVEAGYLQLEHAVGSFGAVCSQLALVLSQGNAASTPNAFLERIVAERDTVGQLLEAIDRVEPPPTDLLTKTNA